MKTLLLSLLFVATATQVFSQTKTDEPKQQKQESKDVSSNSEKSAMEKAWEAYMTPGPMHEMISKWSGKWKEEITMWETPGAQPTKHTAEVENKMIFGNRYQEAIHKGEFWGMPFEGRSYLGFDNAKKMFVSTWMDNMGTGIMKMQGKYSPETKTINFSGITVDPETGREQRAREIFKIIDDNTQHMEFYTTKDGKETKTMEIKFTRTK